MIFYVLRSPKIVVAREALVAHRERCKSRGCVKAKEREKGKKR